MTLTATYDSVLSRVQLAADSLGASAREALVERSLNQVTWTTVRGGHAAPISSGNMNLDDYEFDADVENFYRVTPYDAGLMTDAFTRTVANGWGTATSSHTWSHPDSTASHFSTNGTKGIVTVGTVTDYRRCEPSFSPASTDFDLKFTVAIDKLAASDWTVAGVSFRHTDDDNRYFARIEFRHTPANTVWATLYRETATVVTELGTVNIGTYAANDVYGYRVQAEGSELKFKVWANTDPEPISWSVEATDTDHTSGDTMVMSAVGVASTTVLPVTFTFDDFQATYDRQAVGSAQEDSITPVLDTHWLKSIPRPFLNREVKLLGPYQVKRRARAGVFEVVGRTLPVAVNDVGLSREIPLQVQVTTVSQQEAMDALVASGDVVYLHSPASSRVPSMYLNLGEYSFVHSGVGDTGIYTIPAVEVAAPSADVVGATVTWNDVVATYATWNDLIAAETTWFDLLNNIGDPSQVIVS